MSDSGTAKPAAVEALAAGAERYAPADFAGIVRPLTTQQFLDTHYRDKRPAVFRAEGPRFAGLCTWEQLNALLRSDAWYTRMNLVSDSEGVPSSAYTVPPFGHGWRRSGSPGAVLDNRRLQEMLRKGASIVMPGVHELLPALRPVADALEETLGCYATVNLYASWISTPGFSTHWDAHDVFVLQVIGSKRWQIYGETRRLPLLRDSEDAAKPPGGPVWNEILRAGDVLYIPRGWWHDARAETEDGSEGAGSLHLTCSALALTGLDFMEWLSGRLTRHERFRGDLPHPTDGAGGAHYAALRELILKELDGDLQQQFRDHLRATWSDPPRPAVGPFLDPWKNADWERYEIRLRGARQATLEHAADGDVVLQANGYRWTFDGRCADLLAPLLRGAGVRPGEFRAALDGKAADLADKFLKLLVRQGIATATPPAPG